MITDPMFINGIPMFYELVGGAFAALAVARQKPVKLFVRYAVVRADDLKKRALSRSHLCGGA